MHSVDAYMWDITIVFNQSFKRTIRVASSDMKVLASHGTSEFRLQPSLVAYVKDKLQSIPDLELLRNAETAYHDRFHSDSTRLDKIVYDCRTRFSKYP